MPAGRELRHDEHLAVALDRWLSGVGHDVTDVGAQVHRLKGHHHRATLDGDLTPQRVYSRVGYVQRAFTGTRRVSRPGTEVSTAVPGARTAARGCADPPRHPRARAAGRSGPARVRRCLRFWWCDPSLGVGGGGLHDIGRSAEVNVLPQNGEILACTTLWEPQFVNGGHECLFVEVTCTSDAVTQPFRPDLDRHVAQRNVHVTQTAAAMTLTLNNPFRTPAFSRVAARSTRLFGVDLRALHELAPALDTRSLAVQLLDARVARQLTARGLLEPFETAELAFGQVASIGEVIHGHVGEPSTDPDRERPPSGEGSRWDEFIVAESELEPGGTAAVDVSITELPREGEIDVHHLVQLAGDSVIGGYAFVVLPE